MLDNKAISDAMTIKLDAVLPDYLNLKKVSDGHRTGFHS